MLAVFFHVSCNRIIYKKIHGNNPAIPLLDIYQNKFKTLILKDICTPIVIETSFTIAKIWQQCNSLPIADRRKNRWYIYTVEYSPDIKMNETWINLEDVK